MEDTNTSVNYGSTFHTVPGLAKVIGKYEIIGEAGRGSMGTVYEAFDPFANRKVAIKVAHPHFVKQDEDGLRFRKLFFNEAHAAGVLSHPSILSLFDAGVDGETCYLVMEFISGARTLESFCKPNTLLSVREIVGIIYKCAKALDYAHRQGIIHRDIKPSNILFTDDRDIKISERYATGLDLAADMALLFDDLEKVDTQDALRDRFDSLSKLGFFKSFNDAEIWSLVRASNWDSYVPGKVIINEGDKDHSFYIILAGQVTIQKNNQIIETLKEGDCFGEMGFLSTAERTASVTAKTDVSLIRVNQSTLDRADESTQLRFLKVFVGVVIERLKLTTSILTQLCQI